MKPLLNMTLYSSVALLCACASFQATPPQVKETPLEAEHQYALGKLAISQNSWDAALKHFDQALKTDKHHLDALNGKAMVLVQQGRWEAAQKVLEEALSQSPKSVISLSNLGYVQMKRGLYIDSHFTLRRALELAPHSPSALSNWNALTRETLTASRTSTPPAPKVEAAKSDAETSYTAILNIPFQAPTQASNGYIAPEQVPQPIQAVQKSPVATAGLTPVVIEIVNATGSQRAAVKLRDTLAKRKDKRPLKIARVWNGKPLTKKENLVYFQSNHAQLARQLAKELNARPVLVRTQNITAQGIRIVLGRPESIIKRPAKIAKAV
jgi:tetratricopeptide (TPR) repeat protein